MKKYVLFLFLCMLLTTGAHANKAAGHAQAKPKKPLPQQSGLPTGKRMHKPYSSTKTTKEKTAID